MPGHPIDKEENVPTFLLHDRLERVDQDWREESRTLRQREQAEGKKAIDAFAVAGDHKSPFRIARAEVFGFRRQPDAIGPGEIGKNLLVPSLLKAVELDRLPQQRISDRLAVAQNTQACLALGLHRNVPDRQIDQSAARVGIERRPIY